MLSQVILPPQLPIGFVNQLVDLIHRASCSHHSVEKSGVYVSTFQQVHPRSLTDKTFLRDDYMRPDYMRFFLLNS